MQQGKIILKEKDSLWSQGLSEWRRLSWCLSNLLHWVEMEGNQQSSDLEAFSGHFSSPALNCRPHPVRPNCSHSAVNNGPFYTITQTEIILKPRYHSLPRLRGPKTLQISWFFTYPQSGSVGLGLLQAHISGVFWGLCWGVTGCEVGG